MASKTTLSAANLERLGAERLAELLIELSKGNAPAKQQLRLALAHATGPHDAVMLVRKRLRAIARSTKFVEGPNRKRLQADLETQRQVIVDTIAQPFPVDAYNLIWEFLGLAPSIYERCDDSSGTIGTIFAQARIDLHEISKAAIPDPAAIAEMLFERLNDNGYGQYDGLISVLADAMGETGLAHLKLRFEPQMSDKAESPWQRDTARYALQDIADAMCDPDSYLKLCPPKLKKRPAIAAEIASRFLMAGRPQEAMAVLERADPEPNFRFMQEWQAVRIDTLEALNQTRDAQAARWIAFEQSLDPDALQAILNYAPESEHQAAEEKALTFAHQAEDVHRALHLFLLWPALDHAAKLVEARFEELDGNYYQLLSPATQVLEKDYPLATTLVCRALINETLDKGRSTRYRHAARHLETYELLDLRLVATDGIIPHETYVESLRSRHGKKSSFWAFVE